ncbi:MAG: XRE family transcriptional regulator [Prevotellaceae bacterium]|nr:XRE family transcriptional regulator [Prevotellaceae bacterium]
MGTKERLIEFIKYKDLRIRDFSKIVHFSNSYVHSIRKSIQPDKLKQITDIYPELNPTWLITGEGNMLRESKKSININGIPIFDDKIIDVINDFQATIKEKDEQIASLISVVKTLSENKVSQS